MQRGQTVGNSVILYLSAYGLLGDGLIDLALMSVHVPIMSMESVCSVACSDISVVSHAFITSVRPGSVVQGHALLSEYPDHQL